MIRAIYGIIRSAWECQIVFMTGFKLLVGNASSVAYQISLPAYLIQQFLRHQTHSPSSAIMLLLNSQIHVLASVTQ